MTLESLLLPISEQEPCGEDLSFSTAFDEIAELRREDDPTLDQGEWVTALKIANWPLVQTRCAELLSQRSKDLRLAMWFAEASALTQGYPGLRHALQLCTELSRQYWPGLHPRPEEGDMEQRIGNVAWFLSRLGSLAQACVIARGSSGTLTLQAWQAAKRSAASARSGDGGEIVAAATQPLEQAQRMVRDTPKAFLREVQAAAADCCGALEEWQAVLDKNLGSDSPSFAQAREALEGAALEVKRVAREAGALDGGEEPSAVSSKTGALAATTSDQKAVPARSSGPLRTREDALAQLRDVARFFRTTEPHSPVAYLADKAVRWGEMPLHEWLRSVVKDAGTLAQVEEALGVESRRAEGDGSF